MSTGSDLEKTSIAFLDDLENRAKKLGGRTAAVLAAGVERELSELRGGYNKLAASGGKDGTYTTAQAASRIQNTIGELRDLVTPKEANKLNKLYLDEVSRASGLGKTAGLDLIDLSKGNKATSQNARPNTLAIEAAGRRLEQFWAGENQQFKDRIQALTQVSLAQGKSFRQLSLQIRELLIRDQHQSTSSQAKNKKYGIKGRADLIARTEMQAAFIGGTIDRFRARGLEWVRWSAAAERSCPFCMSRDGLVYELSDVESDIPAHPRCRCTLLPSQKPKDWEKQDKGNLASQILDDAYWAKSRKNKLDQWKKEYKQKKPQDTQNLDSLLQRYMNTPTNSRRRLLGTDKAPEPVWKPSGSFIPDLAAVSAAVARAEAEAAAVKERPDKEFTHERFSDAGPDGPDENTKWTTERQKLHDDIVGKFLKGGVKSANPTFTMSGGGPASGKGFMLKETGLGGGGRIVIDADEIKKLIPEYSAAQKKGGKAQQAAAGVVHEESSFLAKRIMKEAAKKSFDMVLDGTGDSGIASLTKKVKKMREAGYRVEAKYVSADTELAAQRNWERFLKTGRLPPEWMLRNVHADVSRTLPQAIKDGLFDAVELFDTNKSGALRKVLSQKGGKKPTIHDKQLYDDFLKKGEAKPMTKAQGDALIETRRLNEGLMSVSELKELAKKRGIKDYQKLDKGGLESALGKKGATPAADQKPAVKKDIPLTASQQTRLDQAEWHTNPGYIDKTVRDQMKAMANLSLKQLQSKAALGGFSGYKTATEAQLKKFIKDQLTDDLIKQGDAELKRVKKDIALSQSDAAKPKKKADVRKLDDESFMKEAAEVAKESTTNSSVRKGNGKTQGDINYKYDYKALGYKTPAEWRKVSDTIQEWTQDYYDDIRPAQMSQAKKAGAKLNAVQEKDVGRFNRKSSTKKRWCARQDCT
ncbi:predicted protein [Cyanophage PSS2]|nr:predicted protein [Cyanophage PSS2]